MDEMFLLKIIIISQCQVAQLWGQILVYWHWLVALYSPSWGCELTEKEEEEVAIERHPSRHVTSLQPPPPPPTYRTHLQISHLREEQSSLYNSNVLCLGLADWFRGLDKRQEYYMIILENKGFSVHCWLQKRGQPFMLSYQTCDSIMFQEEKLLQTKNSFKSFALFMFKLWKLYSL